MSVLSLKNLKRTFVQGGKKIEVLKKVNLSLEKGEIVGLLGHSGTGKSTLLQLAGLLEFPDKGEIHINGKNCGKMDDQQRTLMRRHHIGFVYQFHHLLPEFDALENVILPQRIAQISSKDAKARASELLTALGLKKRLDHLPSQLSGGEQQRVAIARALANKPELLLADEPTGNLDEATADKVMNQLVDMVHAEKVGALIATHNLELAGRMDRCFQLSDGELKEVKT